MLLQNPHAWTLEFNPFKASGCLGGAAPCTPQPSPMLALPLRASCALGILSLRRLCRAGMGGTTG